MRLSLTKRERPMFQAFVIVLREAFEAFLIVSIIFSYLRRMEQRWLLPAVRWGIAVSLLTSAGLGVVLYRGVNEPLWEAILGLIAAILVTTLVIHMWRHGRFLKRDMENRLKSIFTRASTSLVSIGVFLFTVFMITREGMETALLLIQVPEGRIVAGALMGIAAMAVFAYLWVRFSAFINLRLFFQVTGIFLLLFVAQILIYSFHEFTETGLIPHSEFWHVATEPFSSVGLYGKWFSVVTVGVCAAWLLLAGLRQYLQGPIQNLPAQE